MSNEAASSYEILIKKLQGFISNYYLQRWLKGLLQLLLVFLSFYLITSTLEYNLYFGVSVRKAIFFIAIIGFFILLGYWILLPLWHYIDNKRRLNQKQAAHIIGKYFPEVSDKLLNVIYLQEMKGESKSYELIEASIHQKSKSLMVYRFTDAVDWAKNRKLAKYLLIPFLILLGMLVFIPTLLKDSSHRLFHYNQVFSPKAPFDFILLNKNLKVPQYESLSIQAKLQGKSLPENMNLVYNGIHYPMDMDEKGNYCFTVKNIATNTPFRLEAASFLSEEYNITIVPKPIVGSFELEIIPPQYTGIKSYQQKNIGDIQAPEGSTVIWKFYTENVDNISLTLKDKSYQAEKFSNGYGLKLRLLDVNTYSVKLRNHQSPYIDTQRYGISLTSDAHPVLSVNEFNDSIHEVKYYAGDVSDDYGVSSLYFIIQYAGKQERFRVNVPTGKNANFNFSTFNLFKKYPQGAHLEYYFELYDNDQIHGPKSVRSSIYTLKKLTEKEIEKVVDNHASQIQSELKKSLQDAKQFQKEIELAKKKLLEKEKLDFNDKKLMEELLKKQEELQQKLESTKDEIKRNFEKKNELTQQEKSILDQQKQLEEIIEQMKNPELKELLNKINELLNKEDKKELLQNMKQMDEKSEKMEKNFDRLLQLYKNLDYKQKLNDMIDKLEELSKEQKKLSNEAALDKNNQQEQKKLSDEVKEAKKKLQELSKLNDEINKTDEKEMEDVKNEMNNASSEQEDAEKELSEGDTKSGSQKQDNASKKLDEAKKKLDELKKKQKKKQNAEDARMMRRLLENVIYLSFEQERILDKTKITPVNSPSFLSLMQNEQRLKEDFKLIEDTLYKIASRQSKIRKFIFEEVDKINSQTDLSIKRLVDRRPDLAIPHEQFSMEAYNKLGLMLSESLKNIQEDEEENESDAQQCNNPSSKGKKKKKSMSMDKLAEMQQQLNEQMEKLQQKLGEKGKQGKQGSPKQGEGEKQGQTPSDKEQNAKESAEFAKIAAQQQAIRNMLKKIEEQNNTPDKSGKKPFGNELKDAMEKMNQTESDLVNKRFYDDMLKRQKEIQIKLLESAKAEREQDEETRRESERAKNTPPDMPSSLKQYLENKKQNESQIQRTPVGLTPYFKSLSEKYFKLIR